MYTARYGADCLLGASRRFYHTRCFNPTHICDEDDESNDARRAYLLVEADGVVYMNIPRNVFHPPVLEDEPSVGQNVYHYTIGQGLDLVYSETNEYTRPLYGIDLRNPVPAINIYVVFVILDSEYQKWYKCDNSDCCWRSILMGHIVVDHAQDT